MCATDGSAGGWCGIVISCRSGKATVFAGHWPEDIRDFVGHSCNSEPLALLAAATTFFRPGTSARVLHVTDNTGTRHTVAKGWTSTSGQFVMEALSVRYPSIVWESLYYPGASIPTDEPSRGLALDESKLRAMCTSLGIDLRCIRDLTHDPIPFDQPNEYHNLSPTDVES